jgi:hypothetical protein
MTADAICIAGLRLGHSRYLWWSCVCPALRWLEWLWL